MINHFVTWLLISLICFIMILVIVVGVTSIACFIAWSIDPANYVMDELISWRVIAVFISGSLVLSLVMLLIEEGY